MRRYFVFSVLLVATPLAAQSNDPMAYLRHDQDESSDMSISAYRPQPYRAVRPGEVQSAGFLTELRNMPFGRVLGPVDPPVVHSTQSSEAALSGTVIAVEPPSGAAYQRGDTVMLALVMPGPREWGDIVLPTGLAIVGDHTPRQTMARVVAMYGPIRDGQVVLPLEPLANPGNAQPVTVAGPSGEIILSEEPRELQQAGGRMFINLGRAAGIRLGDFIQVRRRPSPRVNTSDTIDDLVAVAQVVHLGDKTSTIKLIRVIDPDIRAGTPVVRVATLPN